jgi:hypothetical protein
MKVKWGQEWFIEVHTESHQSFEEARKEADSIEIDFNLNCVVERMTSVDFRIFCRGNKYHEIVEVKKIR